MTSADTTPGPPALDRRARVLLPLLFVLLVAVTVYRYSRPGAPDLYTLRGAAMGTTWSLKLAGSPPSPEAEQSLARAISGPLRLIDKHMSNWHPDSDVSRFNAHASVQPFRMAREVRELLRLAAEVSQLSGGAFDITVEPLVRLWGFGPRPAGPPPDPPSEAEIQRVLANVGHRKLVIDPMERVRKRAPGVRIDLSGIAKGKAVDQVGKALMELGYEAFLFELGGEVLARGTHEGGAPWRVAIEQPRSEGRAIHRVVLLQDSGMATSGDYRSFYERDGKRYSHTIDPRTGHPIEHMLGSVTVVHPEVARADALATALNVLGPEAGLALAREKGLAAYFIERVGSDFKVSMTESFRTLLAPEPADP